MQRIIIKEIRGPLGKGDKKFFAIKDEKGSEFTTFDPQIAKLTPGTIIDAEIVVDGKYINIPKDKWTLIEAAPAVAPTSTGGGGGPYKRDTEGIRFEYELKAYMQGIERTSIEAQTAYNGLIKVLELVTINNDTMKLINKLAPGLLEKALKYAESRLDLVMASKPPQSPQAPPEKQTATGTSKGKTKSQAPDAFKNVGELMTWALDHDISRAEFLDITHTKESELAKLNLVDAKALLDDYLKFKGDLNEPGGSGVK